MMFNLIIRYLVERIRASLSELVTYLLTSEAPVTHGLTMKQGLTDLRV